MSSKSVEKKHRMIGRTVGLFLILFGYMAVINALPKLTLTPVDCGDDTINIHQKTVTEERLEFRIVVCSNSQGLKISFLKGGRRKMPWGREIELVTGLKHTGTPFACPLRKRSLTIEVTSQHSIYWPKSFLLLNLFFKNKSQLYDQKRNTEELEP